MVYAQEEHIWDYAPDNGESCSGSVEPFGSDALTYVTANSTRIGRSYIKALFVEYTDGNFTTVKVPSTSPDAKQGTQGTQLSL